MRTCVIAQAGGPTAVVNSSLAGAVGHLLQARRAAPRRPEDRGAPFDRVLGALNGVAGILDRRFVDLTAVTDEQLDAVRRTPGAALGACRRKLGGACEVLEALEVLADLGASGLIYIGGNDSMDTALAIHREARRSGAELAVVGVPKTVDNDVAGTDHCPGYGSAAKYVATSAREASIHAASLFADENVVILETVGRHTGWLAASAALARGSACGSPRPALRPRLPNLVYLPEQPFSFERFLEDVRRAFVEDGGVFAVVAEGLRASDGAYVGAVAPLREGRPTSLADQFGHPQLGEAAHNLTALVRGRLRLTCRYIKPDVCAQSAFHLASKTDWEEAHLLGSYAAHQVQAGRGGVMAALRRTEQHPAHAVPYAVDCVCVPLEEVANVERPMPPEFLDPTGPGPSVAFLDYLAPLVAGEVPVEFAGGTPRYQHGWLRSVRQ